jgi:hypothetical protein
MTQPTHPTRGGRSREADTSGETSHPSSRLERCALATTLPFPLPQVCRVGSSLETEEETNKTWLKQNGIDGVAPQSSALSAKPRCCGYTLNQLPASCAEESFPLSPRCVLVVV